MSSYRDDREALAEKVKHLERELADVKERLAAEDARVRDLDANIATLKASVDHSPAPPANAPPVETPTRDAAVAPTRDDAAIAPPTAVRAQRSNGGLVPLVLVGAVVAGGIFVYAKMFGASPPPPQPPPKMLTEVAPVESTPPPAPTGNHASLPLDRIPGAPHRIDALALYDHARANVLPDAQLVKASLSDVAEDGTIDVDGPGYEGTADFEFIHTIPAPPVDPRAPKGIVVPRATTAVEMYYLGKHGFSEMEVGERRASVPKFTCSAKDVWTAAREKGAPGGSIAQMVYAFDSDVKAVAWRFTIRDHDTVYWISDPLCKVLATKKLR